MQLFHKLQESAANSTANPVWVDEESANLRGVQLRIQQGVLTARPAITTKQCLAFAPTATANDHRLDLHHEIRSILDQLAIDAVDGLQRALDLSGCVILRLQSAHRGLN